MREILLLCEYPTLNGGERSMLATLDGLRAAGFAPVVMAPPDGPLSDELARRGVELLPFCCRTDRGERMPLGRLREELADVLRRRRPALLARQQPGDGAIVGPRGRGTATAGHRPPPRHRPPQRPGRGRSGLPPAAAGGFRSHAGVSRRRRIVGRENARPPQRRGPRRVPPPPAQRAICTASLAFRADCATDRHDRADRTPQGAGRSLARRRA